MNTNLALKALDSLIKKSRIHFYKPIQIAEILYRARTEGDVKLSDIEDYRNRSKIWRDQVSQRLVGRISTSSQKYQDNIFEQNAIPPGVLIQLGKDNKNGKIEKHIYEAMAQRLSEVAEASAYLNRKQVFNLPEFLSIFKEKPGLRRSIDKAYEIVAYSVFSTIISALEVQTKVSVMTKDEKLLKDFADFKQKVLGLRADNIVLPATVYRAGVTNAADRGLDMWANFGPAIQVKHIDLTEELAEEVSDAVPSNEIVLIVKDADKKVVQSVLAKTNGQRIKAIITIAELNRWYDLCLSKYKTTLGPKLMAYLRNEFNAEFPSNKNMKRFMQERGYL